MLSLLPLSKLNIKLLLSQIILPLVLIKPTVTDMKQTASKISKRPSSSDSDTSLKALQAKIDKAEKAVQAALAAFEKKHAAYKDAAENEPAKNIVIQVWSAMKIARLTYKIKRIEYKLAKSDYKFAKKAAKKAEPKSGKEAPVAAMGTPKQKVKKAPASTAA